MPTCPAGHQSSTPDYCDTCGLPIGGEPPDPPVSSTPLPAPGPGPVPAGPQCPECGTPRGPDDAFCEVCGLDFATGARPAAPPPPTPADAPPAAAGAPVGTGWVAVLDVDADFFATNRADDPGMTLTLPSGHAAREIPLTSADVRIGRGEDARGIRPDIDLSLAPGDPGVSHRHATLSRRGDGWVVVDQGSTNGTRVGSAGDPIRPGEEVALADGDHLLIGVWTRVTLRHEGAAQ